ncbi:MAG: flagellar basal body rod protein FlgC [Parvularculaceae bacterium]
MDDLASAIQASAAGLRAQSGRLRVTAENIANAQSTGSTPGADPYRRQVPIFDSAFDRALGAEVVRLRGVRPDPTPFELRFDPGHPAADAEGYVKLPNVNALVEMMDLREAQRSYEANLGVVDAARAMAGATLRILG